MRIAAVIPNWNGRHFLEPLLRDLRAQQLPLAEVIVVDNGSTDGSVESAEAAGARVIRFDRNRGFAPAVNAGVAAASPGIESVAICNNDISLSPDYFQKLAGGLGSAAFACGKLLSARNPQIVDGCFDAICAGGTAWRCGSGRPDGPLWSQPAEVQFAPFTAVLIRREVYHRAGGLDERFESYLEDVDFGLRCASLGHTGRYVPGAVAYHHGSGTRGPWHPATVRQISRNQVLLLAKHYSPAMLRRLGWRIAVAQALWALATVRYGAGLAWAAGKWEGIRLYGAVRQSGEPVPMAVLERSEAMLLALQRSAGPDLYWRLYFALT